MNPYDTTTPHLALDKHSNLETVPQSKTPFIRTVARSPLHENGHPQEFCPTVRQAPFGLGFWTTIALVSLLTALIVGGTIGGGLGASLASCEKDKSSASDLAAQLARSPNASAISNDLTAQLTIPVPTATATSIDSLATNGLLANYAVIPATNVYNVSLDCEDLASKAQRTISHGASKQEFQVYCGLDFATAAGEDANGNAVPVLDLVSTIQYTLANCLEACASYNTRSDRNGFADSLRCRAVTFTSRLHEALSEQEGNCWIKNGTPADIDALPVISDLGQFFVLSAALQE